jgi:ribose transport system permease protein
MAVTRTRASGSAGVPVAHAGMLLAKAALSRYAIVGLWGLMVLAFALAAPGRFLTVGTFQTIFGEQQAYVFLMLALTCTLAVGEFDLSIASMLGLAATLVPVLASVHHLNLVLACVLAAAACTAAGLVNGLLVVAVGINPIVTTLGMATLLEGIALWVSGMSTVGGLSLSAARAANTQFLGLPLSFYYGLVLTAIFAYLMSFTPLGRYMTFVGANREVARLAGIRVNRIRMGAFIAAGAICGVGGVIAVLGLGGYDPTSSATYLLPAFASTFLGTAIVLPARFNPAGGFIAVYFLVTGIVGLQLLGYAGWITDFFFGLSLIVAVAAATIVRRRHAGA